MAKLTGIAQNTTQVWISGARVAFDSRTTAEVADTLDMKSRKYRGSENTCANSSLVRRMTRQLAGIEKHLERHPRDSLSQQRVSAIKSILSNSPAPKALAA